MDESEARLDVSEAARSGWVASHPVQVPEGRAEVEADRLTPAEIRRRSRELELESKVLTTDE